ncbi:hypothetical protein FRAAL6632 [Frankia alni ACN14a]|uniref:Uncharacterized protein n=1 Tax=Frankia alni (strain DSM 45986 / CECT 9034 / ACN14a) TaxID=326424 RepID=Q0RBD1_FRAAA|nr:hypothetical protein FRAAL6632 [Frankia alni ACN14a]
MQAKPTTTAAAAMRDCQGRAAGGGGRGARAFRVPPRRTRPAPPAARSGTMRMHYAGVVQRQNTSFPSLQRGFDSRRPLRLG